MPDTAFLDFFKEVREQANEQGLEWGKAVFGGITGPDGAAPGDVNLSRSERIARFVDLANRGVLDVLQEISPEVYRLLVKEYLEDMAESPLVQPIGVR